MNLRYRFSFIFILTVAFSCTKHTVNDSDVLFTKMEAEAAGITFVNQLDQSEELNTYTFRNFYNGAGVAVGDINNDGLLDIYFCGNTRSNRLYLNKGNFQFEDITVKAGVACENVWSTGVSMADVNGDGLLDIYVCKSGPISAKNRHNELFINNGDQTFTEKAKEYGLDILGLSIQANFFDYDRDGDLDCYLLNNSVKSEESFIPMEGLREVEDPDGANMLLRNDDMIFTNVTGEAKLYSSKIGFGLGATVADINKDNWPDLYISNDFFERDYLYINNRDGTFSEQLERQIRETSMGAMGADIADLNNDAYVEIYVTEMTPEFNERQKTKTVYQSRESYLKNFDNGYFRQFARNTLQLNNRNNTFSEIGRYADVAHTDWSWGALIFDMDYDGYKDIFVANGIYKDLLDRDYLEFYANPRNVRDVFSGSDEGILTLIEKMPSVRVSNYAFSNHHDLTFVNNAEKYGLDEPSFSNGAAYGDLDNDGDLDLVINNINMPPFIFSNESCNRDSLNFLSVKLTGEKKNSHAVGSKVILYCGSDIYYQELFPVRGFMSSVDDRLNFGLGMKTMIDSVQVIWPDGTETVMPQIASNQFLQISKDETRSRKVPQKKLQPKGMFTEAINMNLPTFTSHENDFNDFERYPLLFHMNSNEGPKVCVGDVNNDGRDDFYVCGASGEPGALFLQKGSGFERAGKELFRIDAVSEETDCSFFDADNDGDLDLYVTCGGAEFPESSTALIDKLYLNNGDGIFTKSPQILPSFNFVSTSCVKPVDFDNDGDLDLFVGGRMKTFQYGIPPDSYLLINDGKGKFAPADVPALKGIGHVTDAVWSDIDSDGDKDLIIVGEWMPVTVLYNDKGMLTLPAGQTGLENSNGWWNTVESCDVDNDGDIDFVAGNHGLNTRFKASSEMPVSMYVNDFDLNGSIEQIITTYNGGVPYPAAMKTELVEQIPSLGLKLKKFDNYKNMTLDSLFSENILIKSVLQKVYKQESSVILNSGDGTFKILSLPAEAQFSPVYGILLKDWNGDGLPDILLGGNQSRTKPEAGTYLSGYGLYLKGQGDGTFKSVLPNESGISIEGEIRDFQILKVGNMDVIIVAKNNSLMQFLKLSDQ